MQGRNRLAGVMAGEASIGSGCWPVIQDLYAAVMALVVVVCGFLGSGKTSLILGLGRRWAAAGKRVAVVENEIGSNGIDGPLLERSGMLVREITEGCICCTLALHLREGVAAIIQEHHPDVICVEPTGAAGPGSVINAMHDAAGVEAVQVLAVVDALRIGKLHDFNPDYLPNLLAAAQVVALTKVDAAGSQAAGAALRQLDALDHRAVVLGVDTAVAADIAALAGVLDHTRASAARLEEGHGVAVATAGRTFTWPAATTAPGHVEDILRELGRAVADPHGVIPGHLKAFIDAGDRGWMSFSLTHLQTGCQRRGGLPDDGQAVTISVSAIIAGVHRSQLVGLLDLALLPRIRIG